jgi:hypothetical protein
MKITAVPTQASRQKSRKAARGSGRGTLVEKFKDRTLKFEGCGTLARCLQY